jgi:chorismate-pyruvate lyase
VRALRCALALALALRSVLWLGAAMAGAATPEVMQPVAAAWPDSFLARVEALALLQTLNAELLSHDSATTTLERWCSEHHLASDASVRAERVSSGDRQADDEQRALLRVGSHETVRYRRVKLWCGGVELSEADNWYVPSRLTNEMNVQLDSGEMPFGKVIRPLHFQRHTISATLLWQPLPPGWENAAPIPDSSSGLLKMPAAVLQHRALLCLPDGTPISEVVETYTSHVLAFPAPRGALNSVN